MAEHEHIQWLKSRGPMGYWLSLGVVLLFHFEWSLNLHLNAMALSFGTLSSVIAMGVAFLALIHHPKGWRAVRIYAFANVWIFAFVFASLLFQLQPFTENIYAVVSTGVATVVWLAVFQYFNRTNIQRLFPPEEEFS